MTDICTRLNGEVGFGKQAHALLSLVEISIPKSQGKDG